MAFLPNSIATAAIAVPICAVAYGAGCVYLCHYVQLGAVLIGKPVGVNVQQQGNVVLLNLLAYLVIGGGCCIVICHGRSPM
jgi:hypothetical protein